MCEIIPGTYDSHQDRLNILIDDSISLDALNAIRKLAEQVQRGEISPKEAKEAAEQIAPKSAKLFDIANWSDQAQATLLAAIIGAIAIVVAARMTSGSDTDITIQPIIEHVIESSPDKLRGSTAIGRVPPRMQRLKPRG